MIDPEDSMRRQLERQRHRAESLEQRDQRAGYIWWEELPRHQRAYWMKKAKSSIPLQCWESYKRVEAETQRRYEDDAVMRHLRLDPFLRGRLR